MNTYDKLLKIKSERGAGYFVLLDPDKESPSNLAEMAKRCQDADADALLIGGSLLMNHHFEQAMEAIKNAVTIPVILFPGGAMQVSKHADALLFMSLISGRNPQYLIGEQVHAAPLVKTIGIETIPMGYMLIESGTVTSVEFVSNSKPIPREKTGIAVAHGLAGEYLGMKLLYLEAGSGAKQSVPEKMVQAVSHTVSIPVIVGGGISSPDCASKKVEAGASFIVTGTVLEDQSNHKLIGEFARAIHQQ